MVIAIVLILLVVGSVLFHFLSPWYFTPIASNWGAMDDTISLTFWVTGFVFVIVNLFMAYCVVRYRRQEGRRAAYEPENKKLEWWLIGLTAVGIAAMLAPGLSVWAKFVEVPNDAAVLEVVGKQWNFSYRFPGNDGKLGTVDAKHISDKNPFGINPDDPNGQDDVLIPGSELHLPVGKPVKLLLCSIDVLHNFTVPQFRAKMDMVPGMVTYIWLTPTRTGKFDILCNELCGVGHFVMRGKVVVEEEQAYKTWLSGHSTVAQVSARAAGDVSVGKQLYAVCAACHGAQAEGNAALHAPKLSGLGDWYVQRQLKYFKQGIRGAHDKDVLGKMMVPMAATLTDDIAIENVSAYIKTLPDNPATATVKGSANDGQRLYVSTCGACHGRDGRGLQATNAPGLKGMSDWYLVTQLKNFKQGIRGAHPQDMHGSQMVLMSKILPDDQRIDDLVAYINSLR